jgi:hypothetical protein
MLTIRGNAVLIFSLSMAFGDTASATIPKQCGVFVVATAACVSLLGCSPSVNVSSGFRPLQAGEIPGADQTLASVGRTWDSCKDVHELSYHETEWGILQNAAGSLRKHLDQVLYDPGSKTFAKVTESQTEQGQKWRTIVELRINPPQLSTRTFTGDRALAPGADPTHPAFVDNWKVEDQVGATHDCRPANDMDDLKYTTGLNLDTLRYGLFKIIAFPSELF